MSIIWRKEMSVANEAIDQDHRYLFCLVNTVELALRTEENRDLLDVAVTQLLEYTEYHFAREEALQSKIQYPKRGDHRGEHLRIVEQVKTIREQVRKAVASAQPGADAGAATDKSAKQVKLDVDQIVGLLREWVLGHVLKRDREMIPWLEQYPSTYS